MSNFSKQKQLSEINKKVNQSQQQASNTKIGITKQKNVQDSFNQKQKNPSIILNSNSNKTQLKGKANKELINPKIGQNLGKQTQQQNQIKNQMAGSKIQQNKNTRNSTTIQQQQSMNKKIQKQQENVQDVQPIQEQIQIPYNSIILSKGKNNQNLIENENNSQYKTNKNYQPKENNQQMLSINLFIDQDDCPLKSQEDQSQDFSALQKALEIQKNLNIYSPKNNNLSLQQDNFIAYSRSISTSTKKEEQNYNLQEKLKVLQQNLQSLPSSFIRPKSKSNYSNQQSKTSFFQQKTQNQQENVKSQSTMSTNSNNQSSNTKQFKSIEKIKEPLITIQETEMLKDENESNKNQKKMNQFSPSLKRKITEAREKQQKNYDFNNFVINQQQENKISQQKISEFKQKQLMTPKSVSKNQNLLHFDQKKIVITDLDDPSDKRFKCEICGRKFNAQEVKDKHMSVCEKVFVNKRKQFNSDKQRMVSEEHKIILQNAQGQDNFQDTNKLNKKWKIYSLQFRSAMEQNKKGGENCENYEIPDDRLQCQYCKRKFNKNALERHQPICEINHNKCQINLIRKGQIQQK